MECWGNFDCRVANDEFYVSRGTFSGKKIPLRDSFSIKVWFLGKDVRVLETTFVRVVDCLLYVSRGMTLMKKQFFETILLFYSFRSSSGKEFQSLETKLRLVVKVHSRCLEEHFQENNFSGRNDIISSILEFETKFIRDFLKFFPKICLHWHLRVGWNVIVEVFFFEKIMFLSITSGICLKIFQKVEKTFRRGSHSCIQRLQWNNFMKSKFHQYWTLKRNWFRIPCQISDKVVITEIYVSSGKF